MITRSEIQLVRSLADKHERNQTGLFVAEGRKLVGELRDSALHVHTIYAPEGVFEGANVVTASPKEMQRLSLLKTPSDAVALVEIPHHALRPAALAQHLVLALDEIQNPGNLGTIIRLADWFGITDIICSETSADCFNPKVVQATMGAITRVKVHYAGLPQLLTQLAEHGAPIYGTFLEGENLYHTQLTPAGVVVMGNEGQGVRPATAACISRKLLIPPYPVDRRGSESLNVAMATGIVCAEFRRQASTARR